VCEQRGGAGAQEYEREFHKSTSRVIAGTAGGAGRGEAEISEGKRRPSGTRAACAHPPGRLK
jgi:hypothetical protein